ncbi:hypothetical protein LSAT2_025769 [Lamellibrachia satsuma]|nr:hypothetical protein LSAT2_025769 [Lamellibrachia satsuma]
MCVGVHAEFQPVIIENSLQGGELPTDFATLKLRSSSPRQSHRLGSAGSCTPSLNTTSRCERVRNSAQ